MFTSPSGKMYIGQTINIKKRLRQYKMAHCKTQTKIYNAIRKYGWHNFDVCILFEYESNNKYKMQILLDAMEKFCIKKYDSINKGYNIRFGGSSGRISEETKEKMRISSTGKEVSVETRNKRRLAKLGTKQSDATRLKRSMSMKNPSKERRLEMSRIAFETSEARYNTRMKNHDTWFSEQGKINHLNSIRFLMKEVVQLSPTFEYINKFESIASASRLTGVSASNISMRCSRSILFKTKKFMWMYYSDYINLKNKKE